MSNQVTRSSTLPYEGLDDKIRIIQGFYTESLNHADIRSLAEALAFDRKNALDIKGFYDKLKSLVRYIPDPTGTEFIKSPWVMVDQIHEDNVTAGDCDDFASLAYSLLHSVGIEAELYVGWYRNESDPTHIFVGVPQKNGTYVAFDLCSSAYGKTAGGLTKVRAYA